MDIPVTRFSYASDSAEEVWDLVSRLYMRVRFPPPVAGLHYAVDSAATASLGVDLARCSPTSGVAADGSDQLILLSWLRGRVSMDFGRYGGAVAAAGDSSLYPPGAPGVFDMDDYVGLAVRLSPDEVGRAVEDLTGLAPGALRFTSVRPLSAAHGRLWGVTARMLWEELTAPGTETLTPLVHRELVNTVAAAVVSAFPNTAMTRGYVPGPGYVGPATLRRALAYVDAHASLPVTVADMADAAGVSPATLRSAFRRHLGTTPSAHLRRVRLDAAHRDLVAADPTGADPSLRWRRGGGSVLRPVSRAPIWRSSAVGPARRSVADPVP